MRARKRLVWICRLMSLCLLTACGGGGGGSSNSSGAPSPPPAAPALIITTSSLSNGVQSQAYGPITLQSRGGTGAVTWSASGLPSGMTMGAGGVLNGTPASNGAFAVGVQAEDSGSPRQSAGAILPLTIQSQLQFVGGGTGTITIPQHGRRSEAFSALLPVTLAGGVPPYGVAPSGLPVGFTLGLNPAGNTLQLSGTPQNSGTFQFGVTVTDQGPPQQNASAAFQLMVNPKLEIVTAALPPGITNAAYSAVISAFDGVPPLVWSVDSLPAGISLAPSPADPMSIVVSGTPEQAAAGQVSTFTVTDSLQQSATAALPLTISTALQIISLDLPVATQGMTYVAPLSIAGGVPPYTVHTVGQLPRQMSLDPGNIGLARAPYATVTGPLIVGTPDTPGTFSFGLTVQDSSGQSAQQDLILQISPVAPVIVTGDLPRATPGRSYSAALAAARGTAPFFWNLAGGTLPGGLTLDASGAISGTPATMGDFPLTVQVTDSGSPALTASADLRLRVAAPLGRNDSPATATALSLNGAPQATWQASISPYSATGPDHDYYRLTANPGALVTVEIFAQRLSPPSPLDSVLELVNAAGQRIGNGCLDPALLNLEPGLPILPDANPSTYTHACINDDLEIGVTTDSKLIYLVPGTQEGPAATFYVHVFDFRGDARPDMKYEVVISGAN